MSLQLRAGTGAAFGDRWARSLYFDGTERTYGVDLGRLRPLGRAADAALPPADIRSILLVIDRGNAKPDATGTISVRRATIDRP